jgi:hypothetical protein
MNFILYISFLPPILIGFFIVILLFQESVIDNFVSKVFLGLGTGFGLTSSLYFFWSLLSNPSRREYFFLEGLTLVCLLYLVIRDQKKRNHPQLIIEKKSLFNNILIFILATCFLGVLVIAINTFYHITLNEPHGLYDAWAIWDYRARFIFRAGIHWLDAISPLQFHPDYPLLLPLSICRSWLFIGSEIQKVPIVLAAIFTFSAIGLLGSSLASSRNLSQGLFAAFVLSTTTTFIFNGTILSADVPQSFYFLVSVYLTYLAISSKISKPGIIILAGLNVGYSGWVKNEGLMFLFICLGITILYQLITIRRTPISFLFYYLVGMAIPLLTILFFKMTLSPQNDLVNPQNLQTIFGKIVDPSRYKIIFDLVKVYLTAFGGWNIPIFLILLIFSFLAFIKLPIINKSAIMVIVLFVFLQFIGYLVIYLITPFNIDTHIRQSLMRLIIQIYPAFLFALFILLHSPEDFFSKPALIPSKNLVID